MKNIILVTNSIYNLAGHVLLAIVGLISVKYIFSQLGGDMLGLIFFANLLGVVFANIFEKGIFSLTTREVAKFYNKDKKKLISFLGVWSVYVWILFLIIITIIFLIIPYLNDKFINIQYLDIQTTELILCLLSFSVFLNFPCSFYASILNGMQYMMQKNIIELFFGISLQLGVLFLILTDFHVTAIGFCFLVNGLLKLLTYIYFISTNIKMKFSLNYFTLSQLTKHKVFLKNMFGISLISILLNQYDKILISKFLSITTFGTYAVTNNFVNKANLISLSISQAVYPRFCILFEKGEIREIKILFSQIYEIIGVMTLPIYICFFWFSSYLFEFIFNEQISEQLKLPTLFLCIGFYLNGLISCIYRVCLAFDKTKYALFQDIICFFILLPMTYYLVKNYGIIGGSISILFYFIIGNLYFLPIVAKECLNLELSSIFFLHFKVLKDLCLYFSPMFIYCYNVKTSFIEEVLIFTIIILIYYYINIRTLDENSKKNLRMFIKRIFQ